MPKKSKGKVPLNKAQTRKVRTDAKRMNAHEGMGARGLLSMVFKRKR